MKVTIRSAPLLILVTSLGIPCAVGYNIPEDEAPYGASVAEVKTAEEDCDKNQMTLNICAWSSYRRSVEALNKEVEMIEVALKDNEIRLPIFTEAQDSWLLSRNADCDLDASAVHGGSMVWSIAYSCREHLNKLRTVALGRFRGCLSGSCGQPVLFYERIR